MLSRLAAGDEPKSIPADVGFTALRVAVGLMMAVGHGWAKVPPAAGFVEAVGGLGFPMPTAFAWAAGLSELVGGLLIAAGLFTRPASLFLAATMGVAAFLKHGADPLFSRQGPSKELALLYFAAAVAFLLAGSGRFGLDSLVRGRRKDEAPQD
ncbi:MAG: DoxX family protein [Planctomycetia bacterium]